MRIDRLELRNFKKFEQATLSFPLRRAAPAAAGRSMCLLAKTDPARPAFWMAGRALGVGRIKVPILLANSRRSILSAENASGWLNLATGNLPRNAGRRFRQVLWADRGHDGLSWE